MPPPSDMGGGHKGEAGDLEKHPMLPCWTDSPTQPAALPIESGPGSFQEAGVLSSKTTFCLKKSETHTALAIPHV